MDTLLQAFRNMGPARLTLMGAIAFGMIGFFIFLMTRLTTPQMSLLYGELDLGDSSKIVTRLESMNVPYQIQANGAQVMVPEDQVLRLRMVMADEGVPSGGSIGYEVFDNADSLGTTNFIQNVNLVRALEGELSRTIRTIQTVANARVHLVLPKRELFSRESQEATASIILTMSGSRRLTNGQVSAVQHMVAAAIPGLNPQRISIIDSQGTLLASGVDEDNSVGGAAAKAEGRKRDYESRIARMIEKLLGKTAGDDRVRAEVTAEIDFDRVTTSEEIYNPDGQVVRSTQSVAETSSAKDTQGGAAVSVAGNLPDPGGAQAEGAGSSSADSRSEETVNFEISKKVVNHTREAGIIKRLSVAVLVDGHYAWEGQERVYTPRTPEEMKNMTALARSAVGYDEKRGDIVEVLNMRFAVGEPPPPEPLDLFFGLEKKDLLRVAEILVLSIVAILVILLVVRPLVSRAFEHMPGAMEAMTAEGGLLGASHAPALAGPAPVPGDGMEEEDDDLADLIDLDRVEGRVKKSSVKKVGEIVEKHPDEALSIVRNWMYQSEG